MVYQAQLEELTLEELRVRKEEAELHRDKLERLMGAEQKAVSDRYEAALGKIGTFLEEVDEKIDGIVAGDTLEDIGGKYVADGVVEE